MPRKDGSLSEAHMGLIREIIGYINEGDIETALSVLYHLAYNGSYTVSMARFQIFWDAYPRKDALDLARWEWLRQHVSEQKLRRIMTALEANCHEWQDAEKIPYASTWLKQRRWLRELPPESEDLAEKYVRKIEGEHGGGHKEDIQRQ
jgi:DNA polymerase III delta prime subunit